MKEQFGERQGMQHIRPTRKTQFLHTCLKIADLSEAKNLDRFVRVPAPNVRLKVELRGPRDFHEVAMFAEHGDAVISHIPYQDS